MLLVGFFLQNMGCGQCLHLTTHKMMHYYYLYFVTVPPRDDTDSVFLNIKARLLDTPSREGWWENHLN